MTNIKTEITIFITVSVILATAVYWLARPVKGQVAPSYENTLETLKTGKSSPTQATYTFPDPCTLDVVTCNPKPHGQATSFTKGKVIIAEVSQYTKYETCSTRQCITAMGTVP